MAQLHQNWPVKNNFSLNAPALNCRLTEFEKLHCLIWVETANCAV